jgi:L-threonylcarbamoyladenylate synthase
LSAAASRSIDAAVAALRAGQLVVYPTETVYGLGASALDSSALARLLALKGRAEEKGLSVLVASLDDAAPLLADPAPLDALVLADAFWPGPLTIVLPAAASVTSSLVGAAGGIGLRCSTDPIACALVEAFAAPITATSANPSGREPAVDVERARDYFGAAVSCYVDDGTRAGKLVSTVVEFSKGRAILRRVGAIATTRLQAVIPLQRSES